MTHGRPFQPGGSGRPRGAKNKLQGAFLTALAEDFAQHGADVIRITRIEEPVQYLKVVASLMPKALQIESMVTELRDDEIDLLIEQRLQELRAPPLMIEAKVIKNGHDTGRD